MKKIILVFGFIFIFFAADSYARKKHSGKPGWQIMNELFDAPIWNDYNLWNDPENEVAKRLSIPEESRTSYQVIYREYTDGEKRILGEPYYSFALFGTTANITEVSIVFANKGDLRGLAHDVSNDNKIDKNVFSSYKSEISKARLNIEKKLTSLLRKPKTQTFGTGDKNTTETVKRWDIKRHSILLSAPMGEYVAIKIVPTKVADENGKYKPLTDEQVREKMKNSVVRRENGDVIIKDIPMMDQGPKGYCVPATWARYFNYIGIPVDMYLLAMAGDTGAGGGTSIEMMISNVKKLIEKNNRRLKKDKRKALIKYIDEYIDQGVPIMWPLFVEKRFYVDAINKRMEERKKVKDFAEWKKSLKSYRFAAKNLRKNPNGAHICMIIGYNKKTREIAISDSWGKEFEERWLTEEEIVAISMGGMYVIKW